VRLEPQLKGEVMKRAILLALLLVLSWACFAQLQGKSRAPETEIVLLYHSDTKGEIEECG